MSTLDELQSEISDLRGKLNTAEIDREALRLGINDAKGTAEFYKTRAEDLESQLNKISENNLENRLAFERIKAERNALWEVLKLQRDKHLVNLPEDGIPDPEPEE